MRGTSLGRFVLRIAAWLPLAFLVWYLAASGFSAAGTAVTIATLVALVLLGAVQLRRGADAL